MTSRKSLAEPRNLWAGLVTIVAFAGGQVFLYLLSAPIWLQVVYCIGFFGLALGTSARHQSYVFIFRVYVPITLALGFLYFYFFVHSTPALANIFDASQFKIRYLELLFDVLSTLYAICTAFLLWKGLTDHDNLRHILKDEANHIQRIIGFLHYFDLGDQDNKRISESLQSNFKRYVRNIRKGSGIKQSEENALILRDSIEHIKDFNLQDANDRIALGEIMKSISDLVMVRSKRISQMEIGMSPYLQAALVIMSLAVLYPFYTVGPIRPSGEVDYVNAVCIFILGGLLSFLQMTLFDISRPFDGYWKIKTDAFDAIEDLIEREHTSRM